MADPRRPRRVPPPAEDYYAVPQSPPQPQMRRTHRYQDSVPQQPQPPLPPQPQFQPQSSRHVERSRSRPRDERRYNEPIPQPQSPRKLKGRTPSTRTHRYNDSLPVPPPAPPPREPLREAPRNQPPPPPQQQQLGRANSGRSQYTGPRGTTAHGVASGAIGGGYGPYSYEPQRAMTNTIYNHQNPSRYSNAPSEVSLASAQDDKAVPPPPPKPTSNTAQPYVWDAKDPDLDDPLHNSDPRHDPYFDWTLFSWRGWINAGTLFILVAGLILLFAGYPIIQFYQASHPKITGFNLGGINASGQIPELTGMRGLIDPDTDASVMTRTGADGKKYNLVWSDEFNTDGRTFWPGDDPFWEAANQNYWPTGDLEWYDPQAITTQDGKLVITMTEQNTHNLNFQSGMLTSWNKMCFTTGYVEVSISMPGSPQAPGLWPGAWMMGNLGRAGYGATTEGMWPYSYDSCDLGTFPNQTAKDGTPSAAATGGTNGGPISYLPGQRLSACTCSGSDHPGPNAGTGRGVPEIDIIETQVDVSTFTGQVSQSAQVAPFNYQYDFVNSTPAVTIVDGSETKWNTYKGGPYQQAVSALTFIDSANYNGSGYAPYGFEWWSDPNNRGDGYVTWFSAGKQTWTMTAAAVGADSTSQVSQRLISEEPMYLILNLGMSPSFQEQDFMHLRFPSKMYIDYVRVYQREGTQNGLTCDPPNRPTANYINNHMNAYTNPNLTTWAMANYTFPRNSLYDGC